jgi:hypothetical protein
MLRVIPKIIFVFLVENVLHFLEDCVQIVQRDSYYFAQQRVRHRVSGKLESLRKRSSIQGMVSSLAGTPLRKLTEKELADTFSGGHYHGQEESRQESRSEKSCWQKGCQKEEVVHYGESRTHVNAESIIRYTSSHRPPRERAAGMQIPAALTVSCQPAARIYSNPYCGSGF